MRVSYFTSILDRFSERPDISSGCPRMAAHYIRRLKSLAPNVLSGVVSDCFQCNSKITKFEDAPAIWTPLHHNVGGLDIAVKDFGLGT